MAIKNKQLLQTALLFLLPLFTLPQNDSGFVTIKGGEYTVGGKNHLNNPFRRVRVSTFSISRTEITNTQFAAFVTATGYITDAERLHNAMVFFAGLKEYEWRQDTTAWWRFPNGKSRGGIAQKMNHPVTCISFADAQAYCQWAGVRLPTLNEWEIACRAGSASLYFWGSDMREISRYANIWKGRNHLTADSSDGYMYTSPVASFAPNPWGLYDMYGNVFEFCEGRSETTKNSSNRIVCARGGSWWCSKNSCSFFNSVDIGRVNRKASFSNQGFRVVREIN
jgi:formylglycine-generating enzyme